MEDFSRELGALGTVARRDHITALTMFAEDLRDSPAQAAQLAAALQTKVEEVEPGRKLPLVYLMDNILKTIGEPFVSAFRPRVVGIVCGAFEMLPLQQQASIRRMLGTWSDARLYSDMLPAIETRLDACAPDGGMAGRPAKRMRPAAPGAFPVHASSGWGASGHQAARGGAESASSSGGWAAVNLPGTDPYAAPSASFAAAPLDDPYAVEGAAGGAAVPAGAPSAGGAATGIAALRGLGSLRPQVSSAAAGPAGEQTPSAPLSLQDSLGGLVAEAAAGVPGVLQELFGALMASFDEADDAGRELAVGEATRAVAKVNPPLARELSAALASLPSTAAVLTASPQQLHPDPFVRAVQAAMLLHRVRRASAPAGSAPRGPGAESTGSAAAGSSIGTEGAGAAGALHALGLPAPELSTSIAKSFSASDAAILYSSLPVVSPHTGWRSCTVEEATKHDAVSAAHRADIEARGLSSRAWWCPSVADWAGWSRVRERQPGAGTAAAAGKHVPSLGWVVCDTLAASLFDLCQIEQDLAEGIVPDRVLEEARAAAAAEGRLLDNAAGAPAGPAGGVEANGRSNECAICGDTFAVRVDESTGSKWFSDAVEHEGALVHAQCLASQAAGSPAQAASPPAASPSSRARAGKSWEREDSPEPMSPGEGSSPSAWGAAGLS
ncbi:hypothetical protein FNF29_00576 [Cafeteria roenbergensis]|uniref:CID domain-containing protein n=1 Tax=Cafeteria roenbergensis TaxID=33653 RepID=A0A5A8DT85_CAFRO|nr:hypothetical protein FNF29_00576 [Cafeteria roenbergensis]KAA0167894.1 hypothetical protein FNF28_02640 [Cafeteria roenbergensis]KAA0169066.1 hypothetical protein FNF31_00226 [Cafeteria roenbergensis]|eukprot:KAA0157224.1 hypothetical protein FNF29_00576 [Cafeteria roenbergensis]